MNVDFIIVIESAKKCLKKIKEIFTAIRIDEDFAMGMTLPADQCFNLYT